MRDQEGVVPEYLTIHEVAELLRLGRRTTYTMLREGRIPGSAKVGGQWRVHGATLIAWMEAGGELADEKNEGGE